MKKNYHTEGREALIDFLSRNPDRQFTVDELFMEVRGTAEIGKSSIYRQLGELCAEESVRRFYSDGSKRALYQYVGHACDCSRHFHEKCIRCGSLRHLECDDSRLFAEHLLAVHGFSIDLQLHLIFTLLPVRALAISQRTLLSVCFLSTPRLNIKPLSCFIT